MTGPQADPSEVESARNGPRGGNLEITLGIPEGFLDELVSVAVERVLDEVQRPAEPFVGVEEAAEFLACGRSRIYALKSADRIPFHQEGSRLLFRLSELEAFVENGGALRP